MKELKIENIDKNLAVSPTIDAPDLRLYDVRKPPFRVYGLYNPTTEPEFKRLPDDVAAATSPGVQNLARNTAGGRVRFATDSPYIAIKAVMPKVTHFPHMPLTGTSGFDLYIDSPDGRDSLFFGSFVPPYAMTDGYESKLVFPTDGLHYVTINFPLYNAVTDLYVGIADGSALLEGAPYRDIAPIVYYGSSITQGGCASRPGNAYQAMISRALNIDHVNLGFSGAGKGEVPIVSHMADMEMSVFVSDYDHNSPTDRLKETHMALYEAVRRKHPDIPYIMISRPDIFRLIPGWGGVDQVVERRQMILDNYHEGRANGDKNLYFIDGASFFRGYFEDSCTVDGSHPNDLGFARMAETLIPVLQRILSQGRF